MEVVNPLAEEAEEVPVPVEEKREAGDSEEGSRSGSSVVVEHHEVHPQPESFSGVNAVTPEVLATEFGDRVVAIGRILP